MSSSASHSPKTVSLLKTATHTFATRKNLPGSILQEPGFIIADYWIIGLLLPIIGFNMPIDFTITL